MSALDSRSLTYLDCFGQRFSAPGSVRYAITSPTAAYLEVDDKPFVVDVGAEQSAEAQQHDVEVRALHRRQRPILHAHHRIMRGAATPAATRSRSVRLPRRRGS